mgnify:CR=1 FL=1
MQTELREKVLNDMREKYKNSERFETDEDMEQMLSNMLNKLENMN